MKGKENVAAYALSIWDKVIEEEASLFAITVLDTVWLEELKASYLQDEQVYEICRNSQ